MEIPALNEMTPLQKLLQNLIDDQKKNKYPDSELQKILKIMDV